jgi:hypothetical protein
MEANAFFRVGGSALWQCNGDRFSLVSGNDIDCPSPLDSAFTLLNPSPTVKMGVSALASCNEPGCTAIVALAPSFHFVDGEQAFIGLPDGWTVQSEDFNIVDNIWTDPRNATVASIPEPPTFALFAVFAGFAAAFARRRTSPPTFPRCFPFSVPKIAEC